ncbi:MAG: flagellar hook protein [Roseburia sp.]|nr:flagellar hook protein [Roseburia sp.]
MVVQHNLTAMNANRMLGITTGQQAKSSEKLSSGYRINRAADDAAGLTISEKMRKQIKGLDQASTNAQDGVSAVQTAEGALTEVHSMLQRMNELAVQASNGTNSEADRQAIQDEVDQLVTEIDRVSETTKFNEIYLLKGQTGTTDKYMAAHDAGFDGTLVDGDTEATFTTNVKAGSTIKIGGVNYDVYADGSGVGDLQTAVKGLAEDDEVEVDGVRYAVKDDAADVDEATNELLAETIAAKIKAGSKVNLTPDDPDAAVTAVDTTKSTSINQAEAITKITAELTAANSIGTTDGKPTVTAGTADTDGNVEFTIKKGYATVKDTLSFNLHVGADADSTNKITVDIDAMSAAGLGIEGINVTDTNGTAATYAIDAIADAVATVSAQRSALGAVQNRLEHTIANLDNVVENTTAAESRIRDTDMAEEMVEYSKNNILAQAGQSMLAQANQSTQGVLSLLQ